MGERKEIRNDHGGALCANVHRIFTGIYGGDGGAALLDLLESDEPIDRHVRAALAKALRAEFADDRRAIRLRYLKPDGRSQTWSSDIQKAYELQCISDQFKELISGGKTRQQAIGEMIDRGIAGRTKIEEAISYGKRAIMRISYTPSKS